VKFESSGWFLYPSAPDEPVKAGRLVREAFEVSEPGSDEVLAEPLYGCWEGNMEHALSRRPVDICRLRGEGRVLIGNAGVVRVIAAGADVHQLEVGQEAIIFPSSLVDRFGYPERMLAYDAPGTMGCLASRIKLKERELVPVPQNSRHPLAKWAAFSVRYITAWSNWAVAIGTFRLLVGRHEFPEPHVWGWGGGTTLAELELARRHGCRTIMLSGSSSHLQQIRSAGIACIDHRRFGPIIFDEERYAGDSDFRQAYGRAENAFLHEVADRTRGESVHVFVDYIGSPVFRATSKALAREGVITTAGWKSGMTISYLRSVACINRQQLIHTHYARYDQALAAVRYAEEHNWMPQIDEPIYRFDDVPELATRYCSGQTGYFPVYSVNPE
jgi:NADPH:quinone reductase-like Zn-dependent oxidoreductase